MSGVARGPLAWTLWASAMVMLTTGLSLSVVGDGPLDELLAASMLVPVAATVGVLIFARVPGNPIGWVLLTVGVLGGLTMLCDGYADYSLPSGPGSSALAELGLWITGWLWAPLMLAPLTFALLLFPDGRLPSRRWRVVAWLAGFAILALSALVALNPETEDTRWGLEENPYGLEGADAVFAVLGVLAVAALPAIGGSVAALVVRFRRSGGRQRQQIKWLAYGGTVAAAITVLAGTFFDGQSGAPILIGAAQSLIPASIGVAILRYRLYDIDLVINRTLVYGVLSATLACAYVASVLLLQLVLSPGSDLAIAGSTLAVAVLFRPARGRIQAAVDRRFYRQRYDAGRTLEGFGMRLRDEIDLDALAGELSGLVTDTMQPAHVSLWLRNPEARS